MTEVLGYLAVFVIGGLVGFSISDHQQAQKDWAQFDAELAAKIREMAERTNRT